MNTPNIEQTEMCVAWCHTCKTILGPSSSMTVGQTLALHHDGCEFTIIDTWHETN
ncbi:MAG TPA: hypothetical protein VKP88_08715 [Candidatus Paceibacterota bacterium]|nr:hypothetical protein [Candidatus Paceibacterota bacterium]